jgi:phenylpyruvate tautomerase PptA (4-oxalocrotonate tautomerase family)
MPYLKIQTNLPVDEVAKHKTVIRASKLVARELGKPETCIMITFAPVQTMSFAGNEKPCAYLELKSIGLPEDKTGSLSKSLCRLMEKALKIPASRVYIEFADPRGVT